MEIKDTIALVTGGSSGMGAATSRRLAKDGAKVAIFDINEEAANKVANEINGIGIKCDVGDGQSVEKAFAELKKQMGIPRICINCAGIVTGARVVGKEGPMKLEDFQKTIQINLIGTFNVLRIAAAGMTTLEPANEDGERGVIINTASIAAFEGQVGQAAYSASKGGIVAMTLPIARELAKFGVRVNTIAPGLINTPMLSSLPEAAYNSLIETTVFPKRLGKPEEFAKLALHIIDNILLNGEVIRMDGAVRLQPK